MQDQLWRLNNLYQIRDKDGVQIRFRMREGMFRYDLAKWYRNIILKARQYGFTTFDCLWALDNAIWNPGISCGIIAHNLDDAKKIFKTKGTTSTPWKMPTSSGEYPLSPR